MRYLPISLKTENANIALIGNGEAALNKLRLLVKTSANITLYAPSPSVELITYLISQDSDQITHLYRRFSKSDTAELVAIFACADKSAENQQIATWADEQKIPYNSPDNPEICTFFVPSIVDRSPVTIAISTEGAAPVLAKQIRAHLEHYLPQNIGKLASFAQNLRQKVQQKLTNMNDKRHFWENFFNGSIADNFLKGDLPVTLSLIEEALENPLQSDGKLYVIHASDPDLLSIKAARILQLADHIYQLEGTMVDIECFTHLSRRDAQFTKISSHPNKPEDGEIIMQIAKQARNGKIIVVIGDDSTQKRKDKISNHLYGKQINIEHLHSAQPSVASNLQYSQTQF